MLTARSFAETALERCDVIDSIILKMIRIYAMLLLLLSITNAIDKSILRRTFIKIWQIYTNPTSKFAFYKSMDRNSDFS